ncbi:unnamed protein product [Bursaphelenchus okinawaensis]|uniref:Hyaluronidase n=1 Tax=Bursaphelenchus okinawaensis TaxID=465554 RepID=A0A811KNY5_9BILA|nr:unnamed protein product [Bursaphelenchus okinawaensis]CAG9109411.1 unnamed protein product [Bursaphelenchus okinawaensis]
MVKRMYATIKLLIYLVVREVYANSEFKVYWNVPDHICNNRTHPEDYGITVNQGHNFHGDKIVIFYEEQLGLFPFCADDKFDKKCYMKATECRYPRNGGVPQNANLTAHLAKVVFDINLLIPSVSFDGLAIIDYECWRPLYEYNYSNRNVYKKYSIELARQKYGINDSSAENVARYEFNSAAKKLFMETLRLAKQMRPFAKWGFWEYPICNYDAGYDGRIDCWLQYRVYNEQLIDLLSLQDALYPRVYFTSKRHNDYSTHTRQSIARIKEALRLNTLSFQVNKPIYPYIAFEYWKDGEDQYYEADDICNSYNIPMLLGADGVIIWSTSNRMIYRCNSIENYISNMLGPYTQAFLQLAKQCSIQNCNSHGTCTNLMYAEAMDYCSFALPHDVYCKCEDGYYGRHCEYHEKFVFDNKT